MQRPRKQSKFIVRGSYLYLAVSSLSSSVARLLHRYSLYGRIPITVVDVQLAHHLHRNDRQRHTPQILHIFCESEVRCTSQNEFRQSSDKIQVVRIIVLQHTRSAWAPLSPALPRSSTLSWSVRRISPSSPGRQITYIWADKFLIWIITADRAH